MAEGNHGHGDDVLCLALPETQHSVSVTIWPRVNISEDRVAALKVEVENMIRAAFRESDSYSMVTRTYPSSMFSFSQLTTEIHTELAEDLLSLEFSNSDIVSELSIPRLSNVAVING